MFTITVFWGLILIIPDNITVLGYTQKQVLFSTAIINMSFSLAELLARGFDQMDTLISSGKFDVIATRPLPEMLQIILHTCDPSRLGRFLVSGYFLLTLIKDGYQHDLLYILFLVITGATIYGCLFVVYGSICFYTTKNLEVFNILTDGTREFSKVPLSFYGDIILFILTALVPLSLVQYYPLLVIFGKSENNSYLFYPLLAYLTIIPTYLFWVKSRRHYRSVGS